MKRNKNRPDRLSLAQEAVGLTLAHAYAKAKAVDVWLHVQRLDTYQHMATGHDPSRLVVDVFDGIVRKAHLG